MSESQIIQAEQLLTELEAVEDKLNRMQTGLRQSHRLATLGTLSAIVAHEFNNILTPMISYCQLALANADDANPDLPLMRKALQRALDGAEKAAHISGSMLGFAREAAGSQQSANISQTVTEVFTCLARDPAKDGISLQVDIPDDLIVAISPIALQQVIMNLVLNARTAMKQGGRTSGKSLAITARADDGRALITVADTGPGIPADLLPRIFEPFVTQPVGIKSVTSSSDHTDRQGTGLGLAVCRDLIQQAAGSIDVESHQGHGTTFRIDLPTAESS